MRIISLILLLFLCITSFTSCFFEELFEPTVINKNSFYNENYLADCKLTNMPIPNIDNSVQTDEGIYLNLSDGEFYEYSKAVLNYIIEKKDIYYKGYWNDIGHPEGSHHIATMYISLTNNYSITSNEHDFVFSTTEQLDEHGCYINPVRIIIKRKSGDLKKENFTYNTYMRIDNKSWDCFYKD